MLQSVKNALEALDYVLERYREGEGASLSDIAKHLGLQNTTTRNMLKTMEECGYLARGAGRSYLPGPKCLDMERICSTNEQLLEVAGKYLSGIAESTGEGLVLSTLVGGKRQVLARVAGGNIISVDPDQAEGKAPYQLVTNRIMLAYATPQELEIFIKEYGLPTGDWNGVREYEDLVVELLKIKKQGYEEEHEEHLACLAFPVFGPNGKVIAAIGSFIPIYRYDSAKAEEMKKSLADIAEKISQELMG